MIGNEDKEALIKNNTVNFLNKILLDTIDAEDCRVFDDASFKEIPPIIVEYATIAIIFTKPANV